jgi:class 3 adenylate cyclase
LVNGHKPEPVLLIIADISGYTRYMTANAKTLAHSQTIITELVSTIVTQVELPLEVAKLEGDAVFLYCRKENGCVPWREAKQLIGAKLLTFFRLFGEKVAELSQSTTCSCNACTHIERLRLKVIVHSGEALFHHVCQFLELAGVDVIIAHRLLKNSVIADQYLLMTAAAREDVQFPGQVEMAKGSESYGDLGRIDTLLYLPDGDSKPQPSAAPKKSNFLQRFVQSSKLFCKLWFSPFISPWPHGQIFRHVVDSTSAGRRFAFVSFTILLTPLFLPAGTLMALFHALKQPSLPQRYDAHHQHTRDGSCCKLS